MNLIYLKTILQYLEITNIWEIKSIKNTMKCCLFLRNRKLEITIKITIWFSWLIKPVSFYIFDQHITPKHHHFTPLDTPAVLYLDGSRFLTS